MPVVETTLIEGYDADTKSRLMKGFARVVRSVMAAPPDGIVTVIREVAPSSYARGGVSRVPGPPLPRGSEVVKNFLAALATGDRAAAKALVTEDFSAKDRLGEAVNLDELIATQTDAARERFTEALEDQTVIVFAEGQAGAPFVERFTVAGKLIADYAISGGVA